MRFEDVDLSIEAALTSIRKHLNMEIGFISEFFSARRCIRYVDTDTNQPIVNVGDTIPLTEGYCQKIVDGELPELMPDTSTVSAAMEISFTASIPVGSHVGVPIRLPAGQLYGTLCCFRTTPETSLNARDLSVVKIIADLIGSQIARSVEPDKNREEDLAAIQNAIKSNQPTVVFHSIVDLQGFHTIGFECLSRFGILPYRPPNLWFDIAETLGLGVDLEMNAMLNGVEEFRRIPEPLFLSLNCGPNLVRSGRLSQVLDGLPLSRIVVEITEQAIVDDFSGLRRILDPLRAKGLRTAMDDAGAGYANLQHLVELGPDIIKLDSGFSRALCHNSATRAMVAAIVAFANEIGSTVIAEGIEDNTALTLFRELGVHSGQGFLFSRPIPICQALGVSGLIEEGMDT